MKKRLPAVILALALCLGLCVPVMAATTQLEGYSKKPQYRLTINHPDNYTISYKAGTYQIREFDLPYNLHVGESFVHYNEAIIVPPEQIPTGKMPFIPTATEIVVDGLDSEDGVPTDAVDIHAYSDPDGDGIYDRRLITNDTSVLPVRDSYYLPSDIKSAANFISANALGFHAQQNTSDYMSVTIPTDRLCEVFGTDTIFLIEITTEHGTAHQREKTLQEAFLFLLTDEDTPNPAPAFTDTPSWCSAEAQWAVEQGITNGAGSATLFAPTLECTHDQILTFLWRAADKPDAAQAPITVASYYQDAVNWAYEKGFISDSFRASAPCTRAQAVWYIWKALEEPQAAKAASFSDVAPNSPDLPAVSWAVEKGVTNGYGSPDAFAPDKVCSRGEIACFLYRAFR